MKDMMMEVYNAFVENETIANEVTKSGIKFFQLPETFKLPSPFIIIDSPIGPVKSSSFGSNKELSLEFSYQINVESYSRMQTKKIAKATKDVMWELGFGQISGGLDTYFEDTKRFVDARRYRKATKLYDVNY